MHGKKKTISASDIPATTRAGENEGVSGLYEMPRAKEKRGRRGEPSTKPEGGKGPPQL